MIRKVFHFSACVGLIFVCSFLFGQTNIPKPAAPAVQGGQALPSGVPADWWSTVKANIEKEDYNITWQDSPGRPDVPSAWQAPNRAQGFQTYFTEEGIRVVPMRDDAPSWSWGLQFVGISRGDGEPSGVPAFRPSGASDNRIEYDRGGITEWYVNCEEGLEQGFTIHRPPEKRETRNEKSETGNEKSETRNDKGETRNEKGETGNEKGETEGRDISHFASHISLAIDLRLTGTLHPRLAEDGQAVDFYDTGNISVIHYAHLKVTDATGRVLPAHFEGWVGSARPVQSSEFGVQSGEGELETRNSKLETENSGGLRIAIDADGAAYPITVDPLATSPAWTATGEATNNQFGYQVLTAGDVNGDGYSDILVIASGGTAGVQKAYLYLGGLSGLSSMPSWTLNGGLGAAAPAGDVNGDGYSDVIFGNSGGSSVSVFYGGPSGLPSTASWSASSTDGNFGQSVASAGDVNGDGYADVIVGSYGGGIYNQGAAYVYLGGPAGLAATPAWSAVGEAASDYFGEFVFSAGDVNGDGYSDVLVTTMMKYYNGLYQAGKAYLYMGGPSGLSGTPAWTSVGDGLNRGAFGCAASAGDVNGDGYSDVIIGEKGYPDATTRSGKVFLYLGGPSGLSATPSWTAIGEDATDLFGYRVSEAGDVNGDG